MIGEPCEIRPDMIIKKKLPQSVGYLGCAPKIDARPTFAIQVVGQHRQRPHVIEVDVREQNVFDLFLRAETERGGHRAGVDEQRVVEKKTGELSSGNLAPRTAKDSKFHSPATGCWSMPLFATDSIS